MFRYRRPSPVPRLLLAAVGLAAGLGLMLILALPRVVAVAPAGGAASSRAPILITFSRPMNPASVEGRVRISPPVAGAFTWSGATLQFRPGGEWPVGVVRVSLEAGAQSDRGLPLLFGRSWEFAVGGPRIGYLLRTDDVANLWTLPLGGGDPLQITHEMVGVREFAVSADGTQIVYSALREDGGADLRRVDRDGSNPASILDCPGDLCAAPALSFDGRRLAYERYRLRPATHAGERPAPAEPRVEVLDLASGQIIDPAPDSTHASRSPQFAPDGRLSYLDSTLQAIAVYDFTTEFTTFIPNSSGDPGRWSPDGQYIVYPEIFFPPEPTPNPAEPGGEATAEAEGEHSDRFYSHLLRATVATNAVVNLSGQGFVEDASPAYSPSGEWLAFGRKALQQDQWTPGRQLWLMRADGSDSRPLTADPVYNHSAFVWSPDGAVLVYMRFDVTDPTGVPEIWAVNADGSDPRVLVIGGFLPEWMP